MMAYLLVGAMVLSTPMTASATEPSIADVYTDTDDGGVVAHCLVQVQAQVQTDSMIHWVRTEFRHRY